MSSYFDELSGKVRQIDTKDDGDFLRQVREIEQGMLQYVRVVMEQTELPEDVRKTIENLVTDFAVPENAELKQEPKTINDRYMITNVNMRLSSLVEAMHGVFHTINERKVQTKHGLVRDNPRFYCQMIATGDEP